ncbi:N-acetylmuramoyl-L-alanine amidase [Saccharospirillum salsuginis]|uniref:N-acetylmuramoyl-L-alanine amidase AmiC n=1 Tax=Saccharospirillum salsuginis TaxID=418750 RepID=A0A918N5Y7_9GAMM|nr:N-acetylmuramoyl-L-alanine amidase [Saccharospirillum salsuginis]GGX40745.1 N-acetylmuramoyl-L-alanine amidase [Saccharospirillum salsuginis]
MIVRKYWLILALLFMAPLNWAADIDSARLWPAPDNTRLVLDLSGPVEHRVFTLANPSRVVVDIDSARLDADLGALDLNDSGISRIRSGVRNGGDIRIVLDLSARLNPRSFTLRPNEQYGHRLVLDLERPPGLAMEPQERQVSKTVNDLSNQQRNIIVAIDAGHGGEDPGAIGGKGTLEKHVVMAIARELYDQLNAVKGYEPFLVRTGDYYVPLQRRRQIARQKNADLFVSIHADAFTSPQASGASVFALSSNGATSAMARYLADQENASDVIGGINGVSLEDKDEVLRSVLVDLSMTATLRSSLDVGSSILGEMRDVARMHKNTVEQAGFAVLKSPDVPSILVETGFISNPTEEANLGSRAYRRKLATAIRQGVTAWFERNPPPGTWVAWQQRNAGELRRYVVVRGDTLSAIASRNGTSVARLKEVNQLNDADIRIGQVLLIPGA